MSTMLQIFIKSPIKSLRAPQPLINIPASCRKNCWSHFSVAVKAKKKYYSIFSKLLSVSTNRFLCDDMREQLVDSVWVIPSGAPSFDISKLTNEPKTKAFLKLHKNRAKKVFIRSINKRIKLITPTPSIFRRQRFRKKNCKSRDWVSRAHRYVISKCKKLSFARVLE